jgi:hypothetical protein
MDTKALAAERIASAMRRVEAAQNELHAAAADLSGIAGGLAWCRAAGALGDRAKALWYRLERFKNSGRYDLDGISRAALGPRLVK